MAGFFDVESNLILEKILRNDDATTILRTTVYIALLTSLPSKAMTGAQVAAIETTYTDYVRKSITLTSGDAFDELVAGATENTAAITFPVCGVSGETVSHWAMLDANAGDATDACIMFGALTSSKLISTGDTPEFAIGELDITLS